MDLALAAVWRLFGALLGEGEAPWGFDEALLLEVARQHRLDAALAEPRLTVAAVAARLPVAARERWQAAHSAALARSVWRGEPLARAFRALAPRAVIVLKGAAYAELLYPSPGDRSLGDVDVLVRPEDLGDALARLAPLGYRLPHAGDPTLDSPENHERQLEGPDLDLDLHQGFTQQARLPVDYRGVFARSLPWPALAPNARLLAPEDALVYHCVHAAVGELAPGTAPAIGLLDLRQMLSRRGAFWGPAGGPALEIQLAVDRAREWGAERMLYATLELAARVFPSLRFAAVAAAAGLPAPLRRVLDRAVVDRAFPPPLASPSRPEVLLRKALLLRPAARWRLLRLRLPQLAAAVVRRRNMLW